MTDPNPPAVSTPAGPQISGAQAVEELITSTETGTIRTKVRAGYIWLLILAVMGSFVAMVAPIGISLALKVQQVFVVDDSGALIGIVGAMDVLRRLI